VNRCVPYSREIPDGAEGLWPKIIPWLRLCQFWDKALRPTHRNGKKLRNITERPTWTTDLDAGWAVKTYREFVAFSRMALLPFEAGFLSMLTAMLLATSALYYSKRDIWVPVVAVTLFLVLVYLVARCCRLSRCWPGSPDDLRIPELNIAMVNTPLQGRSQMETTRVRLPRRT
jgi:hypothetical protein